MTTAPAANASYAHITKDPGICGGQACIDQTRIRVVDLVCLLDEGKTVPEMLHEYPSLSLHAGLTYYYDHRDEIAAVLARDEAAILEIVG